MQLQTERLRLREYRRDDLGFLLLMMQDERVMYAYGGAFSDSEVSSWLSRQWERYEQYGFGLLAVELRETGELIGQCGLSMQPWKELLLPELGYMFAYDNWHRGYALEAARSCLDYAFCELSLPSVCAIIRESNAPSRRLAERLGMKITDNWVKHYRGFDMEHLLYTLSAN